MMYIIYELVSDPDTHLLLLLPSSSGPTRFILMLYIWLEFLHLWCNFCCCGWFYMDTLKIISPKQFMSHLLSATCCNHKDCSLLIQVILSTVRSYWTSLFSSRSENANTCTLQAMYSQTVASFQTADHVASVGGITHAEEGTIHPFSFA